VGLLWKQEVNKKFWWLWKTAVWNAGKKCWV